MMHADDRSEAVLPARSSLTLAVAVITATLALSCTEDQGPPAPVMANSRFSLLGETNRTRGSSMPIVVIANPSGIARYRRPSRLAAFATGAL